LAADDVIWRRVRVILVRAGRDHIPLPHTLLWQGIALIAAGTTVVTSARPVDRVT
jgi:hypothetical protein